jgi:bud emergence protein 1
MKSLRRSLNNDKENKSFSPNQSQPSPPLPGPHSNPLSRPAASGKVAPPQKVIKALKTHRSTNPQELSYQEGDFWYVTSERDGWFEALSRLYPVCTDILRG